MAYILTTISDFAAAHFLRGYAGACKNLHGHNWKVEVAVKVDELDEIGIGLDFKIIKELTNNISEKLDHSVLNEHEYFKNTNPTAEIIARYFYENLRVLLKNYNAEIHAVTIWETTRASARYQEI